MEFNIVNLKITIQTIDPDMLSLRLAESGGDFSDVCRHLVCHSNACDRCQAIDSCAWLSVFSQNISVDPDALKRHQKPPLPFVFSFPCPDEPVHMPGIIECGLVVIGTAIPHIEMLLSGLAKLLAGKLSQYEGEIIQVASGDYEGNYLYLGSGIDLLQGENLAVLSAGGLLEQCPWECCCVGIRLLSPLKIVADGRQCSRFDFSQFVRSLMRRVSSMAYYYAEHEFESDFKLLSRKAAAIDCIDDHFHYLSGVGGNRKLSGLSGHGRFQGEFSGLLPFLFLGKYLHAGKGATFGMGRYEIILE